MNVISKDQLVKDINNGLTYDQIAHKYRIDKRIIVRWLRGYNISPQVATNLDIVKLRIKPTEKGKKLAKALGLEVDVIYS